jgi:thioredoxin reductase
MLAMEEALFPRSRLVVTSSTAATSYVRRRSAERAKRNQKIQFEWNARIAEIHGEPPEPA